MKSYFFYLATCIFLFSNLVHGQNKLSTNEPGQRLIVKVRPNSSSSVLNKALPGKKAERALRYLSNLSNGRQVNHPLSNIYSIEVGPVNDKSKLLKRLNSMPEIEYAEFEPQHKLLFVPNDPQAAANQQQGAYLQIIKAYDAWDIEKGSDEIIIGVIDSGTDLDHPDLEGNMYLNTGDPINGIDDDGDGYTDNYFGWDFADNDNDPTADTDSHGTEVAGQAAASTNNGLGIAGTGFDSQYMPIKAFKSGSDIFFQGYEAIAYAADMGCKVINLSWGSAGDFTQFGQDIIDYAVLEKDALVVAAAGNTNEELDFYPASFEHVLSVGATDVNDRKTSWGTYSYFIDLMAPGESIYSTTNGDSYVSGRVGTSYSSPLTAGAAALVRNHFPELNALQVLEKLRVSADDIYSVSGNETYLGQLGSGRLNMAEALAQTISPSVRFKDAQFNTYNQPVFLGDSVFITGNFINYLEPTPNLRVTLSSTSPYIEFIENEFIAGTINTLDTVSNKENPFTALIDEDTPPGTRIAIRIDLVDGFYQDFQYLVLDISPDYLNFDNETLSMTLAGNGNVGYADETFLVGSGFNDTGLRVMDVVGLAISDKNGVLVDNIISNYSTFSRSQDFETEEYIRFYNNSAANLDARSVFDDENAASELDIIVEQRALAWEGNHLIMEYSVINNSGSDLEDLNLALYTDWDLVNYLNNKSGWDAVNQIGYTYNVSNSKYAGVGIISNQDPLYYSINLDDQNGNAADITDAFSKSDKHTFISQGVGQTNAGASGNGTDVASFTGASVSNLAAGEKQIFVLTYLTGGSLADLQAEMGIAISHYNEYLSNPSIEIVELICDGETFEIDPGDGTYNFYSNSAGTDLLGSGSTYITPPLNSTTTYYAKRTDQSFEGRLFGIKVVVKEITADFSTSPEIIKIHPSQDNIVIFVDESNEAKEWEWTFGNGFTSSLQNPSVIYTTEGDYDVELEVENSAGCTSSISKTVLVRNAADEPVIEDSFLICKGESVEINASNTTQIKVYDDETLDNLLFEGETFTVSPASEKTYFITNASGSFESFPVEVLIEVDELQASFDYEPYTQSVDDKYWVELQNSSSSWASSISWNVNDNELGSENSVLFDYSGQTSFTVDLTVTDSLGCFSSLSKEILPSKSDLPDSMSPILSCSIENLTIIPTGGTHFRFYSDEDLNNLLGTGSQLKLADTDTLTKIFITSIDKLLDSDPVSVELLLSSIDASFSVDPDSLNLAVNTSSTFSSLHEDAVEWLWTINGRTYAEKDIVVDFSQPGVYEGRLLVRDTLNCIASNEFEYTVSNFLTSINNLKNQKPGWKIYPNPSDGKILINGTDYEFYTLLNTEGKVVEEMKDITHPSYELGFSHLKPGTYILKLGNSKQIQYLRLIIK